MRKVDEKNYLIVGEDGSHHQIQQFIKTLTKQTKILKEKYSGYPSNIEVEKYLQKEIDELYGKGAFKVIRKSKYYFAVEINNKPQVKQIMMEMNIL